MRPFCLIRETIKRTKKITNITLAIQALVPATPLKPKNPAIRAITKNIITYESIWYPLV